MLIRDTPLSAVWRACLLASVMLFTGIAARAQQRHSDGLDDVAQYVPYATVLALKACGVQSRDGWPRLALSTAASWVVAGGIGYTMKHSIHEWRPDHSDRRSFPSGHSLFAFAGATALHKEFGGVSPWVSVAGYGVATAVAVDRVLRDRHHWYDTVAGAGIGIAATHLTWWLGDKVLRSDHVALAFTGTQACIAIRW